MDFVLNKFSKIAIEDLNIYIVYVRKMKLEIILQKNNNQIMVLIKNGEN